MFDLANEMFYGNLIDYANLNVLTPASHKFEAFAVGYARSLGGSLTPSNQAISRRWNIRQQARKTDVRRPLEINMEKFIPFLMNINGAYSFREVLGTSKACSWYIHFGLDSLLAFKHKNLDILNQTIIILAPYLAQCLLWLEALKQHRILQGIRVVTPESMQGWDSDYMLWDTIMASNIRGGFSWLANRKRICVSFTRHKIGLWIIGDANIVNASRNVRLPEEDMVSDTEHTRLNVMFDCFRHSSRVINLTAHSIYLG